jgi:hypothetical protein
MCFSPQASFAGGVIISAIGAVTLREVHKPSQSDCGTIPLFFGIQQIVEGTLWLTLPDMDYISIQKISTYIFLLMAQVLWPTMIPVSVFFMEENARRKKILKILMALGLVLSSYYLFCLLSFHVNPQIKGYHIQYNTDFPQSLSMQAFIVYLLVTITPLFVSSIKRTHLLGILMFLSCLVTAIFFTQFLTSVWCFFAALISGVIFWILRDSKAEFNLKILSLLKIISDQT